MLENSTVVVVAGSRNFNHSVDNMIIEMGVAELLQIRRQELRFGGARGTDTVALNIAATLPHDVLHVIVPARVANQPAEARTIIRRSATRITELGLNPASPASYFQRNMAMLDGADGLLVFWDGKSRGTQHVIEAAEAASVPVQIEPLVGRESAFGNLTPTEPFVIHVHVFAPYVSFAQTGRTDPLSDFIRRQKAGAVSEKEVWHWAELVAADIRKQVIIPEAIVPVPRQTSFVPNDLALFVGALAEQLGVLDGTDLLVRHAVPEEGVVAAFRLRFSAVEHARTMRVDMKHPATAARRILVLDNVITTGASLEGAVRALARDLPEAEFAGLALAGSLTFA